MTHSWSKSINDTFFVDFAPGKSNEGGVNGSSLSQFQQSRNTTQNEEANFVTMGNCTSQQESSTNGHKKASSTFPSTPLSNYNEQDLYRNELSVDKAQKLKDSKELDISSRVQKIRSSLNGSTRSTQDYHLKEIEHYLKQAEQGANNGNRSFMEYCIKQVNKHMDKADTAPKEKIHTRIEMTRSSLSPELERNYHLKETEYHLKLAEKAAKDGRSSLMELCIRRANEHFKMAEKIGPAY